MLPCPPIHWWKGGYIADIAAQGPVNFISEYAARNQHPVSMLWLGPRPVVIPRSPELIERVVFGSRNDFQRDCTATERIFGGGTLTLAGEPWAERRRIVSPPMRHADVQSSFPIVAGAREELIEQWRGRSEPFGPMRDASLAMLRVLGRFAFGFEFDAEKHGGRALHRALIALTTDATRAYFAPGANLMNRRRVNEARRHLRALGSEVVDHAYGVRSRGEPLPDMMARLLEAADEGRLSRADLISEIIGFLVAGHETSATGLVWVLNVLARDADLQTACRAEIRDALSASEGRIVSATLERTPLLQRVVKETMRLYPPVPLSVHKATSDTELGGYFIPEGTAVAFFSYATHRDPTLWQDAERFDPDRFLPERAAAYHRCQ